MSEVERILPSIMLIGLNHRSASIGLRERLTYADDEIPAALEDLSVFSDEAYVLSTCNRTELYVVSDLPNLDERLLRYLVQSRDVTLDELDGHYYVRRGDDAVRHLLE